MTMADDSFWEEMDSDFPDEAENEIHNEQDVVYYEAKKATDPDAALEGFSSVVWLEGEEKSQWSFKALEQTMKIHLCRGNRREFLRCYEQLVAFGITAAKWTDFETSMHAVLDHVWTSGTVDADFVDKFSREVLDTLKQFRRETSWHHMMIKAGKRYLELGNHVECKKIIQELKNCSLDAVDDVDLKKGAKLKCCALEIQLQMVLKKYSALEKLYELALDIQPATPHPEAMGIIRECGGMLYFRQRAYDAAYTDFFEALRYYNDTGNRKRCIVCLKYLGLTSMLRSSTINVFDCQEASACQNEQQVLVVAELVRTYQAHNLGEFNQILQASGQFLMEDSHIRPHIKVLQKYLASWM